MRTGAAALLRVIERVGHRDVRDVGRADVRPRRVDRPQLLREDPGRLYVGEGEMDDDGISETQVPFEVDARGERLGHPRRLLPRPRRDVGPINAPLPSTVSATRVAIAMLAGGGEAPNEGHFRPIEVVTRPGSMFHALPSDTVLPLRRGRRSRRSRRSTTRSRRRCPGPCRPAAAATSLARVVGQPRGHGRAVGRRCAAPGWSRRVAARRRRKLHIITLRVGHSFLSRGGLGVEEPVASREGGARARTRAAPGRYRGGLGLDLHFRMLEDS